MIYTPNKKIIISIIGGAIIVIGGFLLFLFAGGPKWEAFDTKEPYKGFFDNPIVEMELQKSLSKAKVSFDDKELIDEWGRFFRALEIKRISDESVFYEDPHDEVLRVIVKTESLDYSFLSPLYFRRDGKLTLKIGKDYYDFKSDEDFETLFNRTYEIAVARYGEVNS